jgi:ABC-type multidrug transport system ATPase subunit
MNATLAAKGLADRLLFSSLDLVIAPGEITGLIGANGAGKPVTELRRSFRPFC